jgi:hypothetical protein
MCALEGSYTVTSQHCVVQSLESLLFFSLSNAEEKAEIPFDPTFRFIIGHPSGFVAQERIVGGALHYFNGHNKSVLARKKSCKIRTIVVIDNTFLVLVYYVSNHNEIVLYHGPTGTETLIMKNHRNYYLEVSFIGNEFLLIASHSSISVFQWEDYSFRYTGCIIGSVSQEVKWDQILVKQGKLYLVSKDNGESILRMYQ